MRKNSSKNSESSNGSNNVVDPRINFVDPSLKEKNFEEEKESKVI